MTNKPHTLYGLRVISWNQESGNYCFGDFEGIIIDKSPFTNLSYILLKIQGNKLTNEILWPSFKISDSSQTSSGAFADYLISEAKNLQTSDEEIVFCDNIVTELMYDENSSATPAN